MLALDELARGVDMSSHLYYKLKKVIKYLHYIDNIYYIELIITPNSACT